MGQNQNGMGSSAPSTFEVKVKYIDFNGSTLYYAMQSLYYTVDSCTIAEISVIPHFKLSRAINSLDVRPLQIGDVELKKRLSIRGKKFLDLRGRHYLEYEGFIIQTSPAWMSSPGVAPPLPPPPGLPPILSHFQVNSH